MLIKPPEDGANHEGSGSRGAVLSGDVSLLRQPCGHVVHDGHDDADGLLRHRHSLGQLELWTKILVIQKIQRLTGGLFLLFILATHVFLHYFILIKYHFALGKYKGPNIGHSSSSELRHDHTYKEKHFGLEHYSDSSWRSDGWCAGWDSQTELHIPL